MGFAILYHHDLKEYDFGPGHPFRGDRYGLFLRFLQEHLPENDDYQVLKSSPAAEEDLSLICRKDYIDFVKGYYRAANSGLSYPGPVSRFLSGDNTPIGRPGKLEEAARLIVGQARMACDLVQNDDYKKVISVGGGMHHAKAAYGEGFCIYNDVAFSGLYLIREYGLDRILILDTDAHAGNGTCEYFYGEPRVLFIDLHQDPESLYPGTGFVHQTGSGRGKGFTINIPLPISAGYDSYELVFKTIVEPVAREFNPQIIIRNGGSDPHFADGLTRLGLTVAGFRMIGDRVREMAGACDGKVIDLIASGYNKEVLPYGWLALVLGLNGIRPELDEPVPVPQKFTTDNSLAATEKVIEEVRRRQKDYWTCLT